MLDRIFGRRGTEHPKQEEGPQKQAERKEKPAVLVKIIKTYDTGPHVGFYVTMPDGRKKLVYGSAPNEEKQSKPSEPPLEDDTDQDLSVQYHASIPTPQETEEVLKANGVQSVEELRGV